MLWLENTSSPAISIDLAKYNASLAGVVERTLEYYRNEKTRLASFKFDTRQVANELRASGFHAEPLIQALESKNVDNIETQVAIFRKLVSGIKDYTVSSKIRPLIRSIYDYVHTLEANPYEFTPESGKELTKQSLQQTEVAMQKISSFIKAAISRIEGWNNTPITINAMEIAKDATNYYVDDAWVMVGTAKNSPSFICFNNNTIEVEDVLEAGDEEFFNDPKIEQDYFNLTRELKTPNSTNRGKVLTLYTARPVTDRARYTDARTIPPNIFFTSKYSEAEGLSVELGAGTIRDIWKIRIDSKYLVQTIDTPWEKQYQAIGSSDIPIRSAELISAGGGKI